MSKVTEVSRRPAESVTELARATDVERIQRELKRNFQGDLICATAAGDFPTFGEERAVFRIENDGAAFVVRVGLDDADVRAMELASRFIDRSVTPHFPMVAAVHACGDRFAVVTEDFDGSLDAAVAKPHGVPIGDDMLANIVFQVLHAVAAAQTLNGGVFDVRLRNVLYKHIRDLGHWEYRMGDKVYFLKNRGVHLALVLDPAGDEEETARDSGFCRFFKFGRRAPPGKSMVRSVLSMLLDGPVDVDRKGKFYRVARRLLDGRTPQDAVLALKALFASPSFSYTARPHDEPLLGIYRA